MFQGRLNTLNSTLKLDTPAKINYYNEVKRKVDNKLGHLERGNYFCYKCNREMKEEPSECWVCTTEGCNAKYDYSKRRWPIQRPHKHLVEKKKEE
jgi:translation initiation factor 2 gamma subunit (eIF-2gamma)